MSITPETEAAYGAALAKLAIVARKSGRAEVRQSWNPKRPWMTDKSGGRQADKKTLRCRQAIVETLRQFGPLSANQIYNKTQGFGDRRRRNAKDWLVTAGHIVPLVEDDRRIRRYVAANTRAREQEQ